MFKRTRGYLLLTMLVLTGLAGRLHSDTLSNKERHRLVNELQTSHASFLLIAEGLSKKQLEFPSRNGHSIRDCICRMAAVQSLLWQQSRKLLQARPTRETGSADADLQKAAHELFAPVPHTDAPVAAALQQYRSDRAALLQYAKTTTDAVRQHAAPAAMGYLDAYQLLLLTTIATNECTAEMEHLMKQPHFPKKRF